MMGIFANCPWCQGRGRQDTGCSNSRGPCIFCPVEQAKEEKRLAERSRQTGEYCDPRFRHYAGPMVYYDVKSGKTVTIRSDVQELNGADALPAILMDARCGCCGRQADAGLWCSDCDLHVDHASEILEASYFAQFKRIVRFKFQGCQTSGGCD